MSIGNETRQDIREVFFYCCGYCGISEIDVGGELEIDHFQPIHHGGSDDIENLVYACTTCNRFKGSYWPNPNAPDSFHLLHPQQDDIESHLKVVVNGRMIGLTPRGWFHIRWLRLNRPQLIRLRQLKQHEIELAQAISQAEVTQVKLQQRIHELEQEVARLQKIILRLTE